MLRRRLVSLAALAGLLVGVAPAPALAGGPPPAAVTQQAETAAAPSPILPPLAKDHVALGANDPFVSQKTAKNPKADWQIARLMTDSATLGVGQAQARASAAGLDVTAAGTRVIVEVTSEDGVAVVNRAGARIERHFGDLLQVVATPAQLGVIVASPSVRYVSVPATPVAEAVTDEAVAATNASTWQARGKGGAGVKVAIVDLGFADYTAAQANGDLPASLTTVDYCEGNFAASDPHGTAVASVVHAMAPAADLTLICIGTNLDLVAAEQYVVANGITIVNHSVGWWNSSRGDGSGGPGTPDAVVADAKAHGILWVNAAGNEAQRHWTGHFIDDGSGDNVFNTANGDIGNRFNLASGAGTCVFLKWDNWPSSNQDYDLVVVRLSDGAYGMSANVQNGTQPPLERFCFTNDLGTTEQFAAVIVKTAATAAPRFDLFVAYTSLQYTSAAGSVTEPASSPNAFAIGAVCWQATTIEPFSSRGPTIDGRVKPDMTGPDANSSFIYGASSTCTGGFTGTSSASPHVAGAAALVKSAYPSYTAAQIQSYLQSNARDLGAAGRDGVYGYGQLSLPNVLFAPNAPTGVVASAGNGQATVWWEGPNNGGSPVSGYTVTASPGGQTCTSTELSCTVFGLTNGVTYTFTVRAANSVGTGPASDPSDAVTPSAPVGAPDAPGNVTASRGDTWVTVAWTAAADNGVPITLYTVAATQGIAGCTTSGLTCRVDGLTNGVSYTFRVTATNANGPGPASAPSNAVVPAGLPGAPAIKSVTPRDRAVDLTWSAANANGSPITKYTVRTGAGAIVCTTTALSCTASGLTNRTVYTFTVRATNAIGDGPVSAASKSVSPLAGATYIPLTPNRLVDSRPTAKIGLATALANGVPVSFTVVNRVPSDPTRNVPANATAVTGNLTVTGQTSKGYFSLTPAKPSGIPGTSTLNFPFGDNRANGVTVPLGTGGVLWVTFVGVASGATAHIVFDVTGYFVPNATGATYVSVTPNRLVDSRPSARIGLSAALANGVPVSFSVTNRVPSDAKQNVPPSAIAVTGNLTVTAQTSKGYFSLTPARPSGIPSTSTLNFPFGDNRANAVTVPVGSGGLLWVTFVGTPGATAHVVFDVTGYFLAGPTGATYVPLTPNRLVDSRPAARLGLSAPLANLLPAQFTAVDRQVGNVAMNVPAAALAVTGNLTVTDQTSKGYFSLTPARPSGIPGTSTLNFPLGDNRANAVAVPLGGGGVLWVTFVGTPGAHAQVVFDVTGYFTM